MKTIFKNGSYDRVGEEEAESNVKFHGWKYVPKSEWKEKVRDAEKAPSTLEKKKEQREASSKPRKIKRKQPKQ